MEELFNSIIERARSQANWYGRKIGPISKASRTIRRMAIILVGLGGLCPLLSAADKNGILHYDVSNWGYVSIAVAGTLVFLDKFFGYSSAWIRYITAEMEIRKQIREFEMRWKIETYGLDLATIVPEKAKELLKLLMDFSALVDDLVKQETSAWALEFQSNLAEFQKSLDSKLETASPGSIKVTVSNAQNYTELRIKLDNVVGSEVVGNTALLRGVSQGAHLITVSGKAAGKGVEAADVVTVEPAKLVQVDIKMP